MLCCLFYVFLHTVVPPMDLPYHQVLCTSRIISSPSLPLPSVTPPSLVPVCGAAASLNPPQTPPVPLTVRSEFVNWYIHCPCSYCCCPLPLVADILKCLSHHLDARWKRFGIFLGVEPRILEAIESDKRGKPDDCMLDLVCKWTSNDSGTGTLPRTWETVVEAVKDSGDGGLAEDLAQKHGVYLSH